MRQSSARTLLESGSQASRAAQPGQVDEAAQPRRSRACLLRKRAQTSSTSVAREKSERDARTRTARALEGVEKKERVTGEYIAVQRLLYVQLALPVCVRVAVSALGSDARGGRERGRESAPDPPALQRPSPRKSPPHRFAPCAWICSAALRSMRSWRSCKTRRLLKYSTCERAGERKGRGEEEDHVSVSS